jgi:hypothetical protein
VLLLDEDSNRKNLLLTPDTAGKTKPTSTSMVNGNLKNPEYPLEWLKAQENDSL